MYLKAQKELLNELPRFNNLDYHFCFLFCILCFFFYLFFIFF